MKKYFIIYAFLISTASFGQYTGFDFLRLKKTPAEDNTSEQILVRNPTTGNVNFVEKDSLNAPQDLQSVLNTGGYANLDDIGDCAAGFTLGNNPSVNFSMIDATTYVYTEFNISKNNLLLSGSNSLNNTSGSITISGSMPVTTYNNNEFGTSVQFKNPLSYTTLSFPAPSIAGEYTLATEQWVIDNMPPEGVSTVTGTAVTGTASDPIINNQGLQSVLDTGPTASLLNTQVQIISGNSSNFQNKFVLHDEESYIRNIDNSIPNTFAEIYLKTGTLVLKEYENGFSTTVGFSNSVSNSTLKFPSPSVAGTYQLATENYVDAAVAAGGGGITSVVAGPNIAVDATDAANPIVKLDENQEIVLAAGIGVTTTDAGDLQSRIASGVVTFTNIDKTATIDNANGSSESFHLPTVAGTPVMSINANTANTTGGVILTADNIANGTTNKYFTNALARTAISLTTTGSGAATYNNTTGVINVPTPSVTVDSVPTDGSTNAVSSNGTFDALVLKADAATVNTTLAGKEDILIGDVTDSATHTGGVVNTKTVLRSYPIPANVLASGDAIEVQVVFNKNASASPINVFMDINTVNNLTSSVPIASGQASTTNRSIDFSRKFTFEGGDLKGKPFTTLVLNGIYETFNAVMSTTPYTVSNTYYILFSATLQNTADSINVDYVSIKRAKSKTTM